MQEQIDRAIKMEGEVVSSDALARKLGNPVIGFGEHETSVLPYPASGIPTLVMDRIGASTEEEVKALFEKTGKMPFNMVIAEISDNDALEPNTMDEVRGQIHYNTQAVLQKAIATGKATYTSAKSVKQTLDMIASRAVSTEVYDSIATWNSKVTLSVLRKQSRDLTDKAHMVFKESQVELTKIGYFSSVAVAEEVSA